MSKLKNTTAAKKTKKPSDPLLKKALATTAANIARIEAAEMDQRLPDERTAQDAVPVAEAMGDKSKSKKGGKGAKPKAPGTKPTKAPKASGAKEQKPKRMSGLDAAAKVLAESKEPMNATDLVKAMSEKGYWTSPGGKTPHATIYAAMCREIKEKKGEARFVKKERGLFAANK
jgi:hypothetical protein